MKQIGFALSLVLIGVFLVFFTPSEDVQREAQAFIDAYTRQYQQLYYEAAKAEWRAKKKLI